MASCAGEKPDTIAVLSPRYFQSKFTEAEWTAGFYLDANGEGGR